MSAFDILRSFAEAREADDVPIRDGITYGVARAIVAELQRSRAAEPSSGPHERCKLCSACEFDRKDRETAAWRDGFAAGSALLAFMDRATALAKRAWPADEPGPVLSKALFAHLLEEAGELAGASRSFWGRSLRPEKTGSLDEVTDELGDVLVIVLRIAATHGADPDAAVNSALTKFERRLAAMPDPGPEAPTERGEP